MNTKKDWKKEVKEILELLVYVAISAGVVFQANYGCSRKKDTDSPAKTNTVAPKPKADTAQKIATNITFQRQR